MGIRAVAGRDGVFGFADGRNRLVEELPFRFKRLALRPQLSARPACKRSSLTCWAPSACRRATPRTSLS